MAMADNRGGRFSLTINGRTFSGRGAAKIMPSRISLAAAVNQDGTGFATVAPKLASLDLSFDRGIGLLWDEDMILESIDVTFVETDAKRRHLFTSARWNGDPTIDSATGEVTGMSIMTDNYLAQQV